jgi:hypothetical protein
VVVMCAMLVLLRSPKPPTFAAELLGNLEL